MTDARGTFDHEYPSPQARYIAFNRIQGIERASAFNRIKVWRNDRRVEDAIRIEV